MVKRLTQTQLRSQSQGYECKPHAGPEISLKRKKKVHSRLKKIKETWQQSAMCKPGLDLGSKGKCRKDTTETTPKN